MPSAFAWVSAASTNSSDATDTEGIPLISNHTVSCKLHVVQDPQSAKASITKSFRDRISCLKSSGAGLVNVGFEYRLKLTPGSRSFSRVSNRSSKIFPLGFEMSSNATLPVMVAGLFVTCRATGIRSSVGSRMVLMLYSSILRETEIVPIGPVAQP
jgi:hypothetical protein